LDKALKILKEIEERATHKFLPIIGAEKAKVMQEVFKKYKPKTVLEIGALVGYSSIVMAKLLPSEGKIISIEIDKNNALVTQKNLEKAGMEKKVELILGDALRVLPKINEKFDLLFLDALKEDYLRYLKLAEKNLKKGSVVVADNVGIFKDSMKDYLEYVRNSKKYKSKTINVPLANDAMEISELLY